MTTLREAYYRPTEYTIVNGVPHAKQSRIAMLRRFRLLCCKARNGIQVTRLWDWADHQLYADDYFALLVLLRPEYFRTTCPNSIYREYA